MAKTVSNMADDKLKVLKLALDKIEKDYGKGSVMMLGDKQKDKIDVISTGSIGLDVALGVGGYASGPMMFMAATHFIPTVVYEPNVEPGLANRLVAGMATRVAEGIASLRS